MKRISKGIAAFCLLCLLSGCGSAAPAPAPTEAPAPEAPVAEMPPAEAAPAPAVEMPPEAPAVESVPEAPAVESVPEAPAETPDPLEFVRFDWKPTEEQATELYEYALPYIQDQPYFVSAVFLYGNNYIVHVNCNPADVEESALPFMRAVRDKFFELRSDVHEIIYILFVNDTEEYSYPVSVSVEDVP